MYTEEGLSFLRSLKIEAALALALHEPNITAHRRDLSLSLSLSLRSMRALTQGGIPIRERVTRCVRDDARESVSSPAGSDLRSMLRESDPARFLIGCILSNLCRDEPATLAHRQINFALAMN